MILIKKWYKHLKDNNMTYLEHMVFALSHGLLCLLGGFYLIVHGILPCFFQSAGSDLVNRLSEKFKNRQ